jgi:predicted house-cleaning noncanonical NTP pyrophosphatase (MazG superfamily)
MHPRHWFSDVVETCFPKDSTNYKKRDRYKKTLEEKIEEKVNTFFENRFMAFI